MFHNDSYAKCDVALHMYAISMTYAILHSDGPTSSDYANPVAWPLRMRFWQGVASRVGRLAGGPPGGKLRAPIEPMVTPSHAFPQNDQGGVRKIGMLGYFGGC